MNGLSNIGVEHFPINRDGYLKYVDYIAVLRDKSHVMQTVLHVWRLRHQDMVCTLQFKNVKYSCKISGSLYSTFVGTVNKWKSLTHSITLKVVLQPVVGLKNRDH